MPIELGRRLIAAGVVPPEEVEAALFLSVVRGVPITRALVDRGALSERGLEEELARRGGMFLRHVVGSPELMARLPRALCRRLAAVPTRFDQYTDTVDVAASDPLDPHITSEFGYHLGTTIRVLRAPMTAIEDAIRRIELMDSSASTQARTRRMTPAFPHGAPESSIPPPPEEQPIPLVRRVGVPLIDPDEDAAPDTVRHISRFATQPPSVSFPSSPPGLGHVIGGLSAGAPTPEPLPPLPDLSGPHDLRPPPISNALRQEAGIHVDGFVDGDQAPLTPKRGSGDGAKMLELDAPLVLRKSRAAQENGAAIHQTRRPPSVSPKLGPSGRPAEGAPSLPFASPEGVLRALREAPDRDAIVRSALRGLRMVARRVAIFVVRRDGYQGWACNVEFGDVDALRNLLIGHDQPSVLATAAAASVYLGPIPNTGGHAALLAVMGRATQDVALVAARAGGRPALVLIADDLGDTLQATRRMTELAAAAGEALSRLLVSRM